MERGERPIGVGPGRDNGPFAARAIGDSASISQDGRDSAAAVQRLTERARQGYDRGDVIAEAQARLQRGELDTDAVYRAVARTILSEG